MSVHKILFVCLGNICRSPTAEAVFRQRAAAAGFEVEIDSAGTGSWHEGERPDARARKYGEERGYSFEGQRSRPITQDDFHHYDLILGMDQQNLEALRDRCMHQHHEKIRLFLDYADGLSISEVPDPYYRGVDGFIQVLNLIEAASDGLITHLQAGQLTPKDA